MQSILFKNLYSVDKNMIKLSGKELTIFLLYVSTQYSVMHSCFLLNFSIEYIKKSKRFSEHLF